MKLKLSLLALLSIFAMAVLAAPAPWYYWKSKLNGALYCAQSSPGEGWERGRTAFNNARCQAADTR